MKGECRMNRDKSDEPEATADNLPPAGEDVDEAAPWSPLSIPDSDENGDQ